MDFTIFAIALTDGSGVAYGVELNKEASIWEDKSPAGRQISDIAQGGNVNSKGGGLACSDGQETALMLHGANWKMAKGDTGGADRQLDPANPTETDWTWEVASVTTRAGAI